MKEGTDKKRSAAAVLISLLNTVLPMWTTFIFRKSILAFRLLGLPAMLAAARAMVRLQKPSKAELKSATLAGAAMGITHFITEGCAGKLGIWNYHVPRRIWDIPFEMPLYFHLWTYTFCLGYSAFGRLRPGRLDRAAFITLWSLLWGVYCYVANVWANEVGYISYNEKVGPGTAAYTAGCYGFGFAVGGMSLAIYKSFMERYGNSSGSQGILLQRAYR